MDDLRASVASYYSEKLSQFGDTPRGVDWNGHESQVERFRQLARIFESSPEDGFSVNDLGSGYGALYDYLLTRYRALQYTGIDLSADMVAAGQRRHRDDPRATFIAASEPATPADYGIASGIFNVRLDHSDGQWRTYLQQTLDSLSETSRIGFAFNCLTSYSDEDKKRDYLYYANPGEIFDLCKRRYSRHVALLHDYGLYEFTILVRHSTE